MVQELERLKSYILSKRNFYNDGFANVVKPSGNNVVYDGVNRLYVGISDNLGNYFYIRSLKKTTYTPFVQNCRIQSYKATTSCRIVSIVHNADEEKLLQSLVNDVSACRFSVKNSNSERTDVFFEEAGVREITNNLLNLCIVSVDFEIVNNINAKDCEINPLKCI